MPERALPATSHAILGVLSFRDEMSGYDVRKYAENSIAWFYWSPAPSQIYAELRRLRDRGLVEERDAPDADARGKRLYRLTPAGRAALHDWIGSPVDPMVMKHGPMLRVWAGHNASPDELAAVLDEYEASVRDRLDHLRRMRDSAEDNESWRFPAVVARWGVRQYEAELETLRLVRDELRDLGAPEAAERP